MRVILSVCISFLIIHLLLCFRETAHTFRFLEPTNHTFTSFLLFWFFSLSNRTTLDGCHAEKRFQTILRSNASFRFFDSLV